MDSREAAQGAFPGPVAYNAALPCLPHVYSLRRILYNRRIVTEIMAWCAKRTFYEAANPSSQDRRRPRPVYAALAARQPREGHDCHRAWLRRAQWALQARCRVFCPAGIRGLYAGSSWARPEPGRAAGLFRAL